MTTLRHLLVLPILVLLASACDAGVAESDGASVASVTITPPAPRTEVGGAVQLTAVVRDAQGNSISGRPIFWASSDSGIVHVSSTGLAQARAPGTAQVAASVGGKSDLTTIVVSARRVALVSIEPTSVTLAALADTVRFVATARDASGAALAGKGVAWTSSLAGVAAVSSAGVATAVGNGVTSISAEIDGVAGTATLNVAQRVAHISVTPPSVALPLGDTVRLRATVSDANGFTVRGAEVAWGSSNAIVAPVDASGLVRGASTGEATVTAAAGGVQGIASVAVALTPVGSVEVTPVALTLAVGESRTLSATVRDERGNVLPGRVVGWMSGDPAVARVDATGTVTAVAGGTTIVSASSGGKSGTATITVPTPAPAAVASVEITPPAATLAVGGAVQLTATPRDAKGNALSGRAVAWTSSNPSAASVDGTGRVQGRASGQALITATVEGRSGTAQITVAAPSPAPVASVEVRPSSGAVQVGSTVQLTATARDASGNTLSGRNFVWTSSDPALARVDENGLVRGVAPGQVTITATTEGKSGTAGITVRAVPVASVEVSPASASVEVGGTMQLTATPRDASGNALPGRAVAWASSNSAIATVDGNGTVKGVLPGSATIIATAEGQSGSATVTVTTPVPPPVASVEVAPTARVVQVGQSAPFTTTLRDANGNVLTGRTVTWTSSNPDVAVVDTAGNARGITPGIVTIRATAEEVSGSALLTVAPALPASLAKVSGDGQKGDSNKPLPAPLVVRVTDFFGNPVPDVSITWTVLVGNGSVSPGVLTTNARGEASTVWTLGDRPKEQAVQASAPGLVPVVFTAKKD